MELLLLFLSIAILVLPVQSSSTIDIQVGVVLDSDSPVGHIGKCCLSAARSDFYSSHSDYKTRLVLNYRDSNGSVVGAAASAIDLIQVGKVASIIGPQTSAQANFVMNLGDRARVPVVSFSATSPSLIPQTPYFVRTAETDAYQVQAIASIVKAFRWSHASIIYEDTEFGNGIMPYLLNALQEANARVSHRSAFPLSADDGFMSQELSKMKAMQTRVFIVHMSQSIGTRLFLKAKELGMMSEGYVWIITSGLMDLVSLVDSEVVEAFQGVLGIKPHVPVSGELRSFASRCSRDMKIAETSVFGLWAYDTLWALAMAVERVMNGSIYAMANEADIKYSVDLFALRISEMGPELLEALLATSFRGIAGDFNLVNGQLEQTPYQIVNIVGRDKRYVGRASSYFNFSDVSRMSIVWPGNSTETPRGWEFPVSGKKLRIGVAQKPGFNDFLKVETDPRTNETVVSGPYKDVFDSVIAALPYHVPYEYAAYPFFDQDGSRVGSYDDLVHQVSLQDHYDAGLGDITITANRSMYADFTLPFEEGGITSIVLIKYEDSNDVFTFLHPLTKQLWLTTAIFYIGTTWAIWILGARFIASSGGSSPDQFAGMICYIPFFPGEGFEGTLLCVVLVTWAFVASLLHSTYTASLASKLTVQKLLPTVTDVTQLIKNGDYVGCQEGTFLVSFLRNLGFEESRIRTYNTSGACNEALMNGSGNGGISAYYDVLPHIRAILSQYCGKYMMVGPLYRTDGFGFAFPKGSPIVADISRAIIHLIENSTTLEFEEGSSSNYTCTIPVGMIYPTAVTLRSVRALFVITGCVTFACLVVSLYIYLSKNRVFLQEISVFKAEILSRIHALLEYLKKSNPPSHPKRTNCRDQVPRS